MIKFSKIAKPKEFDSWTIRKSIYKDLALEASKLSGSEVITIPSQVISALKKQFKSFKQGLIQHTRKAHNARLGVLERSGMVYIWKR